MKKGMAAVMLVSMLLFTACSGSDAGNDVNMEKSVSENEDLAEGANMEPKPGMENNNGILNPDTSIGDIPNEYKKETDKAGKVVRLDYQTASYSDSDKTQDKYVYVYLPYGYDENQQYDVLYLMHGGGGSAETCFDGEGQSSELKCILDNLIEKGKMRPLIVVTPTFYPVGNSDSSVSYAEDLVKLFPDELVNDLLPAVESQYSTYAENTDKVGFAASREHRAFGGFSMGSVAAWYDAEVKSLILSQSLKISYYL